ncbi:hypothetical protein C0Q70_16283 [Pomacea canaliculata]|uniref:Uncharacterized protein n=1 Tax=Pomacea canaliculata TaxID=400727 RepID=A0A2T7NPE7_POMCA|nr:hypothetical protein C0Q70_16283 [Pomacea canaliculata]
MDGCSTSRFGLGGSSSLSVVSDPPTFDVLESPFISVTARRRDDVTRRWLHSCPPLHHQRKLPPALNSLKNPQVRASCCAQPVTEAPAPCPSSGFVCPPPSLSHPPTLDSRRHRSGRADRQLWELGVEMGGGVGVWEDGGQRFTSEADDRCKAERGLLINANPSLDTLIRPAARERVRSHHRLRPRGIHREALTSQLSSCPSVLSLHRNIFGSFSNIICRYTHTIVAITSRIS